MTKGCTVHVGDYWSWRRGIKVMSLLLAPNRNPEGNAFLDSRGGWAGTKTKLESLWRLALQPIHNVFFSKTALLCQRFSETWQLLYRNPLVYFLCWLHPSFRCLIFWFNICIHFVLLKKIKLKWIHSGRIFALLVDRETEKQKFMTPVMI
jgi:hypothetical protein